MTCVLRDVFSRDVYVFCALVFVYCVVSRVTCTACACLCAVYRVTCTARACFVLCESREGRCACLALTVTTPTEKVVQGLAIRNGL